MATLVEKIWDAHVVQRGEPEEGDLLYVDMHLVQEVSSPQAFSGLKAHGRRVRRPDLTLAMEDHNIPTWLTALSAFAPDSLQQVNRLRENCAEHGITLYETGDQDQGIVHVVGPQRGLSRPGMTIVCGDSHTSTHGAFGALAFGIGTSQVEHVLATQALRIPRFQTLGIEVTGRLAAGVTAKDLILSIIRQIGVGGGRGYVVEYFGEAISALSMEARMTVCNMSIEAGARAGLIAPDETTFHYLQERMDLSEEEFARYREHWSKWRTDDRADFDRTVVIDGSALEPVVTWGTNPGQSAGIRAHVPRAADFASDADRAAAHKALAYMDLDEGRPLKEIGIDYVFIGSCTNGRIEDLRAAASVLDGRRVSDGVRMLVVPGSERVRMQAESEGLDQIFTRAGADWRHSGCSMCLGMNEDRLSAGVRSVSTSNRNFEGRQGPGARTHLASPVVAAASAVMGSIAEPSDLAAAAQEGALQ